MDSEGHVTVFKLPSPASSPFNLTVGPDHAMWFTLFGSNQIGRITTAGVVREFNIPTANSYADVITAGADGALWFTERDANQIGRITTVGHIDEYALANLRHPEGIVAGPDGVWLTEGGGNWLTRIATPALRAVVAGNGASQPVTTLPAGCAS
jgi:virginiamycin B lyase